MSSILYNEGDLHSSHNASFNISVFCFKIFSIALLYFEFILEIEVNRFVVLSVYREYDFFWFDQAYECLKCPGTFTTG